ncbi:hypothetical protein ZWY2020_040976 [Hordeum vulgare]|nr:hypothetical protein ZWY2020_040976 [Hordeum vulgare]
MAATPPDVVLLLGGIVEVRALSLPLLSQEKSLVLLRLDGNDASCVVSFLKVPAWTRWESAGVMRGGGWVCWVIAHRRGIWSMVFVFELVYVRNSFELFVGRSMLDCSRLCLGQGGDRGYLYCWQQQDAIPGTHNCFLQADLIPVVDAPFSRCLFV